jgi:hypothetical protein
VAELLFPTQVRHGVILLVLWQIWKDRNSFIFDVESSSTREVVRCVIYDLEAWMPRYRKGLSGLQLWQDHLLACL